jgi:hypothetical protein
MRNSIKNLLLLAVCLLGLSSANAQCGGCTPPPPPSITPNYTLYTTPTLPNSTTLRLTTVISGTTYIQPPSYAATLASAIHQPHIYQALTKKSNGQIFGGTTQYGPGTCPTCWMNFSVITSVTIAPGDQFTEAASGDITCTAMGSGGWAHLGASGTSIQYQIAYTLEYDLFHKETNCTTSALGVITCDISAQQWCVNSIVPDMVVATVRSVVYPGGAPTYWHVFGICTRTGPGAVWQCPTASFLGVGNAYAIDQYSPVTPPASTLCTHNNQLGHP